MSRITDRMELGYFPLQDFSGERSGVPSSQRQSMGGARIAHIPTAGESVTASEALLEVGTEDGLGTLGDVHPWRFWQTRSRGMRGSGAWSQGFASIVVDSDGRYGAVAQPIYDAEYRHDQRLVRKPSNPPVGLPLLPAGAMVLGMAGMIETEQADLHLWTDGRLVAPNVGGPGDCGTLVCDLQPDGELCMDGSTKPGVGGRHAKLQTLTRVIAVQPGRGLADLGAEGNVIAINYSETGEGIPAFGAIYAPVVGGGPTTGGPGTGPVTPGGPYTGPGDVVQASLPPGSTGNGWDTFGTALPGRQDELAKRPREFGSFRPRAAGGHGVAFMGAVKGYGPIHAGAGVDKHHHGTDRDGNPINAAHISTGAYFFADRNRDAPLEFGGFYPYPPSWPLKAKTHLTYDAGSQHFFRDGARPGLWRWWTEVPYVAPTEPPTQPPWSPLPPTTPPGGPGGPTTPGPGSPTPPTPGSPGGPPSGGPGSPGGPGGPPSGGPGGPGGPAPSPGGPGTGGPGGPGGPPPPPPGGGGPGTGGGGPGTGGGGGGPRLPPTIAPSFPLPTPGYINPNEPTIPPEHATAPDSHDNDPDGEKRESRGEWSGRNPWTGVPEAIPGVVERVGGSDGDSIGLYEIHHPLHESFGAMGFRPQLYVEGLPHFARNPQLPAGMIERDEKSRPQVVTMRAWGAQDSATGDWDYTEPPHTSRARGGTVNGGVLIAPPRFEMEDYLGIASELDVEDTAAATATVAHFAFAPGVSLSFGVPSADGTMGTGHIRAWQDTPANDRAFVLEQDGTELIRGSDDGTDVVVQIGQGGHGAIRVPYGTTAERPATPVRGMVRINTSGANDVVEFYDNVAGWTSITGGGGGGGSLSDGDYGDIIVGGSGTTMEFDSSVVTTAARSVLDDSTVGDMRTTLGLGDLAVLDTVSTTEIDAAAVTYAKIQNVSATDKILGRSSAGAGTVEEIACTAAGRALLDDASATDQRTTLGLDSAALKAVDYFLQVGNDLSDLSSASTARTNLGLGSAATTAASDYLAVANDLSDLSDADTAQDNLLGNGIITRHWHPAFVEDFNFLSSQRWGASTNGTGTRYITPPSATSELDSDGADGYLRVYGGSGTASTDACLVYAASYLNGSDCTATGRRHIFRLAASHSSSIKCSFGTARSNLYSDGASPSPSFAFVIDSASHTNVRCQHDDNDGHTTDQDSGVAISSITAGGGLHWFEIRGKGSSVGFYIDGVDVASVSSNLPTSTNKFQKPFFYIEGAGTGYRSLYVDKYILVSPGGEFDGTIV